LSCFPRPAGGSSPLNSYHQSLHHSQIKKVEEVAVVDALIVFDVLVLLSSWVVDCCFVVLLLQIETPNITHTVTAILLLAVHTCTRDLRWHPDE